MKNSPAEGRTAAARPAWCPAWSDQRGCSHRGWRSDGRAGAGRVGGVVLWLLGVLAAPAVPAPGAALPSFAAASAPVPTTAPGPTVAPVPAPLAALPASFTPLTPLPAPRILKATEAFPGNYHVEHLLRSPGVGAAARRTPEYASRGQGAATAVVFDFGTAPRIGGFRHVQRRTVDTIARSQLVFSDEPDFRRVLATVPVRHDPAADATTFATFPPVSARYVRWEVTAVAGRSANVGGKGVAFFAAGAPEPTPRALTLAAQTVAIVERRPEGLAQPLRLRVDYPYAERLAVEVQVGNLPPRAVTLGFGGATVEFTIPAPLAVAPTSAPAASSAAAPTSPRAAAAAPLALTVTAAGRTLATGTFAPPPVRPLTVFLLPHSHTDIGYTALQTEIEEKQVNNLLQGMAEARRTASYPEGARFVWNVEVAWAVDLFLQRLPPERHAEFFAAVRCGQVALEGMYLNELTGLCRPEELVRLFRYGAQLATRTGVPIESAMISDVPGYTWGTVTAMAQAGVKYFSVAPNYFDRIGDILVQGENQPFWWVGPDGRSRVLVWIPYKGYATSHIYHHLSPEFVADLCAGLAERAYPYDLAYLRWAGHGDNAVPDAAICDFVRDWNEHHATPRFVITSTREAFRAFEQRYGDQLPVRRGDWTPYWEDGAGSSAAETALNRASAERLTQAGTLWALLAPQRYPAERFAAAWNEVLLYSEHTWGASTSVTQPRIPFTVDQWTIKQSYATAANLHAHQLLSEAAQHGGGFVPAAPGDRAAVDIYNLNSWPRAELVLLPRELTLAGDYATDADGKPVPTQRLASRELALWVGELPPFSGRRYFLAREPAAAPPPPTARPTGRATADAATATLTNGRVRLELDARTGAIRDWRVPALGRETNLVATDGEHACNDYLYFLGDDPATAQRSGPPRLTVGDRGPLVASLVVESDAPGCQRLLREVRLRADDDRVELRNTVDKRRLEATDYRAREGKESLNFAFPFAVPAGEFRLEVPWGVFRPEAEQIAGSCKNWLTVGRWADVSNRDLGVTWVTLDAPLVQLGGLTANLLNSQTDPSVWLRHLAPTQRLYSWAMNNHWGTNYRAYQEGPVVFRYVLRAHRGALQPAEATRFATACSQPLVAVPARGPAPDARPRLRVGAPDLLVTALQPTDDGRALIVRLFNAGTAPAPVALEWRAPAPARLWVSDTSERPLQPLTPAVTVPPYGLITVRAEW